MSIVYGIGRIIDGTEHYVCQLNGQDAYRSDLKEALLFNEKKKLPDLQGFEEYYVYVKDDNGKLTRLGILKSE